MVALKQRHLALRHLGFSKKVVIIDEVHAYDAYMSQYLLRAIEWMGAYKVPVIILSATLTEETRKKLIESYLTGMGIDWDTGIEKDLEEKIKTISYPLITYTDGFEVNQVREFSNSESKEVEIHKLEEKCLCYKLENLLSEGGIVGIVVNTVKRSQEIAKNLIEKFGEENVELLHSGFIDNHRRDKEENLLNMIGKDGKRPFKKIIVGTQVIEQSLDIDFDVMISDLAPMDLLIQRMGRLHRHNTVKPEVIRPEKLKNPKLYIMGINQDFDFDNGSSYVYRDTQ